MMIEQKEISGYLKQAGKNCPAAFRKKLCAELKDNISDYLEENPDYTMLDIEKHFGSPEKFADEYILAMDEPAREKSSSKAKWIKRSILIGLAIVILITAITAVYIIHENSQTAGYYYSYGIIE